MSSDANDPWLLAPDRDRWTSEDMQVPDWHCAPHGEMGMGPGACETCADEYR